MAERREAVVSTTVVTDDPREIATTVTHMADLVRDLSAEGIRISMSVGYPDDDEEEESPDDRPERG